MVRIHPDPPGLSRRCAAGDDEARCSVGAVAQLGERLLCKQEVIGSIPFSSTNKGGMHFNQYDEFRAHRQAQGLPSDL